MDDGRRCMQCSEPLQNRRPEAVFCRQKCKRRYYRRTQESKYEPPLPGTSGVLSESRADERFRAAVASHQEASQPLDDYERELLARQRRNRGVLLPELQQRLLNREYERRRAEAAEAARADPIRVQDQLDPSTYTSLARRAILSRNRNSKPQAPDAYILRGQPGPVRYPAAMEAEMIDAPWSRGRW